MHLFTRNTVKASNSVIRLLHKSHAQLIAVPPEALPVYNHGLPGKGKSGRSRSTHGRNESSLVDVKGEMLFGIHPILLALKSRRRKDFHCLYLYDQFDSNLSPNLERILRMSSQYGLTVKRVKKPILNQMAGNRPHQGVCLDASELICTRWNSQETVSWSTNPIWLFLQNVKDPMNFGAILRTSFYFGVDRVIVPNSKSCKLSPVASKASSGALEVIDLQRLSRSTEVTQMCHWWVDHGGEIIGADSSRDDASNQSYLPMTLSTPAKPTLLIIGNEGEGLSEEVASLCQRKFHIKSLQTSFTSEIDSLNVSVATGILLHWLQMSRVT